MKKCGHQGLYLHWRILVISFIVIIAIIIMLPGCKSSENVSAHSVNSSGATPSSNSTYYNIVNPTNSPSWTSTTPSISVTQSGGNLSPTVPAASPSIKPDKPNSDRPVRMNMKSYGNHDAEYDARILNIHPQYVIDNPPHGLYGERDGYDGSWLLQNVSLYQAAGIKVIGYITAGYEGQGGDDKYDPHWYSLELNKKLITNMAALDHVDGVFIDECTDFPDSNSKGYLKTLTNLAHSLGLIVWGNVGVDDFDSWYFTDGGFDLMQSSEEWVGQELSPVQRTYGNRISVTGFNPNYKMEDALRLTLDAWSKGIAYCYINTVEYTQIAPWFEQYAAKLKQQ